MSFLSRIVKGHRQRFVEGQKGRDVANAKVAQERHLREMQAESARARPGARQKFERDLSVAQKEIRKSRPALTAGAGISSAQLDAFETRMREIFKSKEASERGDGGVVKQFQKQFPGVLERYPRNPRNVVTQYTVALTQILVNERALRITNERGYA